MVILKHSDEVTNLMKFSYILQLKFTSLSQYSISFKYSNMPYHPKTLKLSKCQNVTYFNVL